MSRHRGSTRHSSRPTRPSDREPSSRSESKELTRQALLRAALSLLSRHSFDSISLREVTRQAGVSPTAFYRHFDDMEELGLVLVEDSFGTLRQMLRIARADPSLAGRAISGSIEVVVQHVEAHEAHMRFIARERYGGVRRLRRAIRREVQLFADELALDLVAFPYLDRWPADDRRMFAQQLTETMVHMTAELLDARGEERDELIARSERQLRLLVLGVPLWRTAEVSDPTGA